MAADGVATSLLVGAALGDSAGVSKPLFVASAATYVLASPVIHAANGRGGPAVGALGLRVFAPVSLGLLGIAAGAGFGDRRNWGTPLIGGLVGFGVGVLAAMVIDAAAIARKESPSLTTPQGAGALAVGREAGFSFGGRF
jgi:hypothetical protein